MAKPLDARLTDLARIERSWPFVGWALLTGRCHAEVDFLAAKRFGHSIARATFHIYADAVTRLCAAAARLGMTDVWSNTLLSTTLPLTVAYFGRSVATVTDGELEQFRASRAATPMLTGPMKRNVLGHLHGLRRLLYEAAMTDVPVQRRRSDGPISRTAQLSKIGAPEICRTILAYLDARASVLRPSTMAKLTSNLAIFGEFLTDHYPELTSLTRLERSQVEAFFSWSATRTWRGRFTDRPVGPWPVTEAVVTLRSFFEDIAASGWTEAPPRPLVFATDVPKPPHHLPRALAPDIDRALMGAVAELDDTYARVSITIMRHTGIRIGELLDLETDCVVDYGTAGRWLQVPLGKLNTERSVPLDEVAQGALEEWLTRRPHQRPVPHPRSGKAVEFIFMEGERRLRPRAIQQGLAKAVDTAHLCGPDGGPLRVTAHQLRHTFATEQFERRHVAPTAHGPTRPQHGRDDDALCHPGITDPQDGL
jgi:integrase